MGDFKPPELPQKVSHSKVRQFDGISAGVDQVIRRTNERGWDISNSVANEVWDFRLGELGTMRLRPGSRKVNDTGRSASIDGIFFITMNALLAYGVIYNGSLDVITIPKEIGFNQPAFDFSPTPAETTITNAYPNSEQEKYQV